MKQERLIVDDYTRRFQELQYLCYLREKDVDDVACYIRGLRSDIWNYMKYCQIIQKA